MTLGRRALRMLMARALWACLGLALWGLAPAAGDADPELEDILGGFEEPAEPEPASDPELDDVLGGFEDAAPSGAAEEASRPPAPERSWDLSGSVELTGSLPYLRHRSAIGGPQSPDGTEYSGLQRLRTRLNLQLDVDLFPDWRMRISGYGFYDFAYLANGRKNYTDTVLNNYEKELDFSDSYVQGALLPSLDLKIGRQIVNWGRSDSIRVIDVLNPLDNREPGRVDIEDLRLPVAMVRADYFVGDWNLTALAIPEIRFDRIPVPGNDYFPAARAPYDVEPKSWSSDLEYGAALNGIFQGWDISFNFARYWEDLSHVQRVPGFVNPVCAPDPADPPPLFCFVTKHSFLTMVGVGGNYTFGSWLFKGEFAWKQGFDFSNSPDELSRIDWLLGVEYYGIENTQFTVEFANRRYLGFETSLEFPPDFARENRFETSIRLNRTFFRERLDVTVLALLFGLTAEDGSFVRVSADYDLRDDWIVGAGILLYQKGDLPITNVWAHDDRFIFRVKYLF